MRILVVHPGPNFSVQDVYTGWCEALRDLGQQVARYDLDNRLTFYGSALVKVTDSVFRHALSSQDQITERAIDGLYAQMFRMRPDVLLVVSSFFVPVDLLELARAAGTKVVLLHTESPYEDERQLNLAPYADLNLLNDPINLARFAERAPSMYTPHAYRPGVHCPGPVDSDLACDLSFIGTGYRSRIDFFEALDLDGLNVTLAGNWQLLDEDSPVRAHVAHRVNDCLDNAQAVRVYRASKTGINLYRREADDAHLVHGVAMGPREVEMAASGLFFLRDPRPEGDEVLPMLPTFTSPEDASEQLRYWLARPDDRAELATKARVAVGDRTFIKNAAAVLRLLEK